MLKKKINKNSNRPKIGRNYKYIREAKQVEACNENNSSTETVENTQALNCDKINTKSLPNTVSANAHNKTEINGATKERRTEGIREHK